MTATEILASPRQRWTIVALLSASIAINLLDRQVINVLAPLLRESMHWTATQYSYIAVGFQVGMMAGQVPIGAFMDRVGTRTGLAAIFVAWSIVGGASTDPSCAPALKNPPADARLAPGKRPAMALMPAV